MVFNTDTGENCTFIVQVSEETELYESGELYPKDGLELLQGSIITLFQDKYILLT